MILDPVPVRCALDRGGCGAVVGDGVRFRGVFRTPCPRCKRRVWIQGNSHGVSVIRIDRKPSKLPTAVA